MNFEEMSEEEILHIANPIMDNLMNASTDIELHRQNEENSNQGLSSKGL
jgi:hypothetical protein